MKSICIALSVLLFGPSMAYSEEIDCESIKIESLHILKYRTLAIFPNTKKLIENYLGEDKIDINSCGVNIFSSRDGIYKIKTDNMALLAKISSNSKDSISIPLIKSSKSLANSSELLDYWIGASLELKEEHVYGAESVDKPNSSIFNDAIVGYKINGGAIRSLWYYEQLTGFDIPKMTKTIDFYAKPSSNSTSTNQRVSLNFIENSITVWKAYPFPKE